MNAAEIEDKARKLTRARLPERKLERLFDAVHRLEELPDISVIGALLSGAR
jgi:hypothetical protein